MFCKNCGKELNDGSTFCSSCGTHMDQTMAQSNFGNVAGTYVTNSATNSDKIKKYITKKNIGIAVAVIVVLCIIGALFGDDSAVSMVKDGYFYFNKDVTVGELLDSAFDDVKWKSLVADDGKTYVNATMEIDGEECIIQFKVNEENNTFKVYACEVNGIPVPVDALF